MADDTKKLNDILQGLVTTDQRVIEKINTDVAELYLCPIWNGWDNVTEKSPNMPWDKGKALLPYLEEVDVVNKSETGFVFPIQRACRPNHTFRGFAGQIEAGRSQLTLDG